MRERTRLLHAQAERAGVLAAILRGQVSLRGYLLLLRNLLPVYRALEAGLERHRQTPGLGGLARPALYRCAALEADLGRLGGTHWERALAVLGCAQRYQDRLVAAAEGDGGPLIAHAYVRYLGDLSGGQLMRGLLARSLQLAPEALAFYAFPQIPDLARFKAEYRQAIDRAGLAVEDPGAVVEEAEVAFGLNIELAQAVQAAADAGP